MSEQSSGTRGGGEQPHLSLQIGTRVTNIANVAPDFLHLPPFAICTQRTRVFVQMTNCVHQQCVQMDAEMFAFQTVAKSPLFPPGENWQGLGDSLSCNPHNPHSFNFTVAIMCLNLFTRDRLIDCSSELHESSFELELAFVRFLGCCI